jgi:hypothetical protein
MERNGLAKHPISRPIALGAAALAFTGPASAVPVDQAEQSSNGLHALPRPTLTTVRFAEPTKDTTTYSNIGASGQHAAVRVDEHLPGRGAAEQPADDVGHRVGGCADGSDAQRVRRRGCLHGVHVSRAARGRATTPIADRGRTRSGRAATSSSTTSSAGRRPSASETVPAEPRYISLGPGEDGNKPVELFGVRFNNEWTAATWVESGIRAPRRSRTACTTPSRSTSTATASSAGVSELDGRDRGRVRLGIYVGDDGQTYDTYYPTGNFLPDALDGFDPSPFGSGASFDIPDGTPGHSIAGQGQQAITLGDELPPGTACGSRSASTILRSRATCAAGLRGRLALADGLPARLRGHRAQRVLLVLADQGGLRDPAPGLRPRPEHARVRLPLCPTRAISTATAPSARTTPRRPCWR